MATPDLQFALLPERKIDRRALAVSYGSVLLLLLILLLAKVIWPERLEIGQRFVVTELIPRPDLEPKPIEIKPQPQPQPVVHKRPVPVRVSEAPKLIVPREIHRPRPERPEIAPPKVALNNFTPPVLVPNSSKPQMARIVHTGDFGSSATATLKAPPSNVQTGGFGDPNGIPGQGKQGAHLDAANAGAFDLPQGPGTGNGTGGAQGLKGTVASAGFGNGIAQPSQGDGQSHGSVQNAGFAPQQAAKSGIKLQQPDRGPATTPVEITFKPDPIYTDEARQLKLEGEVLLEVIFGANGQLRVNRVVRSLGHGLDEAAIAAANRMRFKPALRDGQPVDSTAVVHVLFQLAS
jgi:TonB family protein